MFMSVHHVYYNKCGIHDFEAFNMIFHCVVPYSSVERHIGETHIVGAQLDGIQRHVGLLTFYNILTLNPRAGGEGSIIPRVLRVLKSSCFTG